MLTGQQNSAGFSHLNAVAKPGGDGPSTAQMAAIYRQLDDLNLLAGSVDLAASGTATIPVGSGTPATLTTAENRTRATITVERGTLRFLVDGTVPTPTKGHVVKSGDMITLSTADEIANFKALASAGAPTLQVTYFSIVQSALFSLMSYEMIDGVSTEPTDGTIDGVVTEPEPEPDTTEPFYGGGTAGPAPGEE